MLLLLRNRLKYALTYREVKLIVLQRLIKIDHQVRTDHLYPVGFQDVITIDRTGENFRLMLDTKGRFKVHPIDAEEAKFKLCKVKTKKVSDKGIPVITTHDGRTFRYVDPVRRFWRRRQGRYHPDPRQGHGLRQAGGGQCGLHQRWSQHWSRWCDPVDREAPWFVQHHPRQGCC